MSKKDIDAFALILGIIRSVKMLYFMKMLVSLNYHLWYQGVTIYLFTILSYLSLNLLPHLPLNLFSGHQFFTFINIRIGLLLQQKVLMWYLLIHGHSQFLFMSFVNVVVVIWFGASWLALIISPLVYLIITCLLTHVCWYNLLILYHFPTLLMKFYPNLGDIINEMDALDLDDTWNWVEMQVGKISPLAGSGYFLWKSTWDCCSIKNLFGSKDYIQVYSLDYYNTFSPIAKLTSICLFLSSICVSLWYYLFKEKNLNLNQATKEYEYYIKLNEKNLPFDCFYREPKILYGYVASCMQDNQLYVEYVLLCSKHPFYRQISPTNISTSYAFPH